MVKNPNFRGYGCKACNNSPIRTSEVLAGAQIRMGVTMNNQAKALPSMCSFPINEINTLMTLSRDCHIFLSINETVDPVLSKSYQGGPSRSDLESSILNCWIFKPSDATIDL
jgi:hypothetical protein